MKKINIAIVGATGIVGEAMIELLAKSGLDIDTLYPLASASSLGKSVVYKNQSIYIDDLAEFDFTKADLALFAAGSDISMEYAKKAVDAGCYVVDNSSAFRNDDDIPLIVPEVNGDELKNINGPCIIANPNCSTIQMCVAIEPIYKLAGISRINVSTYQSVSGTGKKAISELVKQTSELLNGKVIKSEIYPKQIAFNAIPHIDDFMENDYTKEEMKMYHETQKIFGDYDLLVNCTAVRVPTVFGHAESVHVETKELLPIDNLIKAYKAAKGIKLLADKRAYPTAMTDAVGNCEVFIGRIRRDITHSNGINIWVVADNVRKGAAWNALQIAKLIFA